MNPSWSDEHREAVARLEDQLGRPVCGVPLADGEPCPAAQDREGCCEVHAASVRPEKNTVAVKPSSSRAGTDNDARAQRRLVFWMAGALVIAILAVGVFFAVRQDPADALWREAAALVAAGRPDEAHSLYQLIIREHPASRYAAEARRLLGQTMDPGMTAAMSPAQKLFQEARNFYPLGSGSLHDLQGATIRYQALADSYPTDPLARDALYEAAQCLDHLGRTEDCIQAWERFLERYPTDGRGAEALYALGFIHYTQTGDRAAGRKRFDELEKRFPESSAAQAARNFLGTTDTASPDGPAPSGSPSGSPNIHTTPGRL